MSLNYLSPSRLLLARLSGRLPAADVAGAMAEVLAERVGEVGRRRKAAPGSGVGHGLGLVGGRGAGQR